MHLHYDLIIQTLFVFKFLAQEIPLFRKQRETSETIYFQGYLNDNLSDTPSEIKDVVDCFDDSGDDSLNSTDSKIIRYGEKNKVVMSSSDYNTDEATDNCWSEIDVQPCLQMFFFCIFHLQMF